MCYLLNENIKVRAKKIILRLFSNVKWKFLLPSTTANPPYTGVRRVGTVSRGDRSRLGDPQTTRVPLPQDY